MLNEIQKIRVNVLPKILSDTVYITENEPNEVTGDDPFVDLL